MNESKKKALRLTVSSATFSEVAKRMQEKGINIGGMDIKAITEITLEQNTEIEQPHDWPQVQLRERCIQEAGKLPISSNADNLIAQADVIYEYVLYGTITPNKGAAEGTINSIGLSKEWK